MSCGFPSAQRHAHRRHLTSSSEQSVASTPSPRMPPRQQHRRCSERPSLQWPGRAHRRQAMRHVPHGRRQNDSPSSPKGQRSRTTGRGSSGPDVLRANGGLEASATERCRSFRRKRPWTTPAHWPDGACPIAASCRAWRTKDAHRLPLMHRFFRDQSATCGPRHPTPAMFAMPGGSISIWASSTTPWIAARHLRFAWSGSRCEPTRSVAGKRSPRLCSGTQRRRTPIV